MGYGNKFLIFVVIVFCARKVECFQLQEWGNYLTDEEYQNRTVCATKVCVLDSDRFVNAATQNKSIQPCDDFTTFSMGEFYTTRVNNDRYSNIGFENDMQRELDQQQERFLKLSIDDKDSKLFKILKKYYAKFSNSGLFQSSSIWHCYSRSPV